MKIGIFIEYLSTAGGGERYIGTIAEHLSKSHDVILITRNEVNLKDVEDRLKIDLSRCSVTYWPLADDEYLSELTSEYDMFINSTFFSSIINRSKFGVALIFFPIVINYNYPLILKKLIYYSLDFLFGKRHKAYEQIGRDRPQTKVDWRIREDHIEIQANRKLKNLRFIFEENKKPLQDLIKSVSVNKKDVEFFIDDNVLKINNELNKKDSVCIEFKNENLVLNEDNDRDYNEELPYYFRLKYVLYKSKSLRANVVNMLMSHKLSGKMLRKLYGMYIKQINSFRIMNYLKSYKLVWAISDYTQYWIDRMYKVKSEILYPPIDIDKFQPSKTRKNIVISVGRFFPRLYGHNKKQLEMIQFFKLGYDKYPEFRKYEYHLVGGMKEEPQDIAYVEECKKEAEGYPIFIHTNYPFKDLIEMCSHSKIFWHGAGHGEDKELHPDLFEHFGMTTVESMSAGVVPIVVNAGGQKEIVDNDINGYVWDSVDELLEYTLKVIRDEELRKRLSKNAIEKSKKYSNEKVLKELDRQFKEYNFVD